MLCPTCKDQSLTMAERQGIEIDYCGKCRGVWLDRGELDKIVERASSETIAAVQGGAPSLPRAGEPPRDRRDYPHYGDRDWDDDDYKYRDGYRGRRRKSILSEIFDF